MKLHYIQHVPFENPGLILDWATQHGHALSCTKVYQNEVFPPLDHFDALVVMGGPMGIMDTAEHPWLNSEYSFIEHALSANKPILGICLGAQLIAHVLGARVYANECKEIGWFPVHLQSPPHPFAQGLPEDFTAFHWHGDTFDIPKTAHALLSSPACRNQAFLYDDTVLALQFHLEVKRENIEQLITHCGHELIPADFIQTEDEIHTLTEQHLTSANDIMIEVLDRWIEI